MELLQYLQSIHPFSMELSNYLESILKTRELRKKEYLLRAGEICRHVCFIKKGLLRCYNDLGDKEKSRWFMREGDVVFSISSFYEQKKGFEYIQALENCFLYYITYNELEYIYKNFMEFNYIGRVLTIKYHQLWDEQLYYKQMSPSNRYEWLLTNHSELVKRVPAKHLASYLGITEVTLSSIKKQIFNGELISSIK